MQVLRSPFSCEAKLSLHATSSNASGPCLGVIGGKRRGTTLIPLTFVSKDALRETESMATPQQKMSKGRPGHPSGKPAAAGKSPAGALAAKVSDKKPQWQANNEDAKKCFISDEQLQQAKEAFFRTDKDGSGSIDREELGFMLRSLGQNPTEKELSRVMAEADRGSSNEEKFDEGGNGKIEMREFLKWYGAICNEAQGTEDEDVMDAYCAFGPKDATTPIAKDKLQAQLLEDFGLEVDVESLFIGSAGNEISHESFTQVISGSLANPRHIAQRVSIS